MHNLKKRSVKITEGMKAYFPQFDQSETVNLEMLEAHDNQYNINNGTLCFIHYMEAFATPVVEGDIDTLEEYGLTKNEFYVPFSNWDYPLGMKKEWEYLQKSARKI